jgi:hypothetical protein
MPVRFSAAQERLWLPHILNYLNTYSTVYRWRPARSAVGYSAGNQASIPLAFNDAMWAK